MKQELINFLGKYAELFFSRIEESSNSIYVYGSCGFISMSALSMLIEFAHRHDCHYYVDSFRDEVRCRIYKS